MSLQAELDALPAELCARLDARGFDRAQLVTWAKSMGDQDARNRISGDVRRIADDATRRTAPEGSEEHARLSKIGGDALAAGQLAVCVLAGGMATRMGGVVKSLVEVAGPHTFLDIRLAEQQTALDRHGAAPPLWLMTSEPTEGPTRDALGARCDGERIATFEQFVSLRLTESGGLLTDGAGEHSVYATGHGDMPDALMRAGLLSKFIERGGRWVLMCNLDNLGARVDAAVLGAHIDSGAMLSVELADKAPGDKGGGPVMHDGRPIICEHFRLPLDFDADTVPTFNTNTFWVDAKALAELQMDWTYVEVHKKVGAATAVQFERLLGEITVGIEPSFLWVSREGAASRFLPVKSPADLETLRPALLSLAHSFGLK